MKKWWKSKTLWLGFSIEMMGAIQTYKENLVALMSPKAFGITMFFVGTVVMLLRFVSDKKLVK